MIAERTTPDQNIAIMREAFNALRGRDIEKCISFMPSDFIINLAGAPQLRGHDAWRRNAKVFFTAFPDFQLEEQDMFAAGDRVAVRFRFTGTHTGPFLGAAPTGRPVDYQSYEFYRIANGKIAEEWICSDMQTILTQIGIAPRGQMLSLWLAGYRVWFAAAAGLVVGAGLALTLPSLFS